MMNMEILFRGKRKDNGEWVEGYFIKSDDVINHGKCYILPTVSDFSYGDNGNRIRIGCFIEVDPATIGQYTGLTDRNGKKIFMGDLSYYKWARKRVLMSVIFEAGEFRLNPVLKYGFKVWDIRISGEEKNLEIIGNVHDNPELLQADQSGEKDD